MQPDPSRIMTPAIDQDPDDTELYMEPTTFEPPATPSIDPMADMPLPVNPMQPPAIDPIT